MSDRMDTKVQEWISKIRNPGLLDNTLSWADLAAKEIGNITLLSFIL